MLDLCLPDLTFPMVEYGTTQIRWDLRILLYKGAAKANLKTVFNMIAEGKFGSPVLERIELVRGIHGAMTARLIAGGKKATVQSILFTVRDFFAWADQTQQALSLDTIEDKLRHWCDFLLHRSRLKIISRGTAYKRGLEISSILDETLERSQSLIKTTRLTNPKRGQRAVGVATDKQNLADTMAFGHLCLDIIDSLPLEVVFGRLPVPIRLRDGRTFEQWLGRKKLCFHAQYQEECNAEKCATRRAAWESDYTLRTRHSIVNLRLSAELLVFIAQTGMNLAQALQLRLQQFAYKSTIDGYAVLAYKARRKGEAMFEIFAEYKTVFENYLAWQGVVFANEPNDRLFPFVRTGGALDSTPPTFAKLKLGICKQAGVPFIGPQKLRSTRVNWLLRQSRNPEQTAEQAQHTKQTLLRVYEKPSLQVAQVEIIQFWITNDPRLNSKPMPCLAPGVCDGIPTPLPDLPRAAPRPDCTHPAGCLFCEHHRDIDSADYVWSAASMRFLQTIILQRFRPFSIGQTDAARHIELTVDVLTTKLKWFSDSNAIRKAWVDEAAEKVSEGDFHNHWRYLIESAQGV